MSSVYLIIEKRGSTILYNTDAALKKAASVVL